MQTSRPFLFFLLFVLLLAACQTNTADTEPTLALEPCRLNTGADAQCGTLMVPENRAEPDGRSIPLHVAVVPASVSNPEPDPVFMLAGGPGQAATEAYPLLLGQFDRLNQTRDIVLIDQRGTGDSNPLHCDNLDDLDPDVQLSREERIDVLQACGAALAADNDLAQYGTDTAVADFDAVREALGYEQINIYGASYGTRTGMTYARRYPDRVRTLVLDAVAGPELVLFQADPRDGQQALDALFARCAADAACAEQFPALDADWQRLLAGLAEPQEIEMANPLSGEPFTLTLGRDDLAAYVYNILYSTDLAAMLPLLIHNAAETGDYTPLVTQAFLIGDSAGMELGLLYTVGCAEDAAVVDLALAATLDEASDFGSRAEEFVAICEGWPDTAVEAVPDDLRAPLTVDVPTLVLSGAADPVTPPGYAETVADALPDSLHIVVSDYGHTVIAVGCMPRLMTDFIRDGALDALDTSCVSDIEPPPFWVGLTGPQP